MISYDHIQSPGLLVDPEIVKQNIAWVLAQVNNQPERLRPHIKTHKTREVNQLLLAAGIIKFKASTIAEAELLALYGAPDVLLSMQPTGPTLLRFIKLIDSYPNTSFACLVDDLDAAKSINELAKNLRIFIDLNVGMNRTGIIPDLAYALIQQISSLNKLKIAGLHAYDGHIRDVNIHERAQHVDTDFKTFYDLITRLQTKDLELVVGGTPSFLVHKNTEAFVCSPGTFVFFDVGYANLYPKDSLQIAVEVIARIISKPTKQTICIDVGHKSIAPENSIENRVRFIDNPSWQLISQSEEHGIVKVEVSTSLKIGDIVRMYPYHICPTVAMHQTIQVYNEPGWQVLARNRKITI